MRSLLVVLVMMLVGCGGVEGTNCKARLEQLGDPNSISLTTCRGGEVYQCDANTQFIYVEAGRTCANGCYTGDDPRHVDPCN